MQSTISERQKKEEKKRNTNTHSTRDFHCVFSIFYDYYILKSTPFPQEAKIPRDNFLRFFLSRCCSLFRIFFLSFVSFIYWCVLVCVRVNAVCDNGICIVVSVVWRVELVHPWWYGSGSGYNGHGHQKQVSGARENDTFTSILFVFFSIFILFGSLDPWHQHTHKRYVAAIRRRISLLHLLFPFYFRLYEFILCAHMSCTVSNCRRPENNTRISCMQIWTSISTSANDKMWSVLREPWPTIIIPFDDIDLASVPGSVDKWIILYTDARRLIVSFH